MHTTTHLDDIDAGCYNTTTPWLWLKWPVSVLGVGCPKLKEILPAFPEQHFMSSMTSKNW